MRTKSVIFDLDDTLVAFDLVTDSTWRQVCREYVEKNDAVSFSLVFDTVTSESRDFWSDEERHRTGRLNIGAARREVVSSAFSKLRLPEADALQVADRYSSLRLENMYVLPGAVETLSSLARRGIRLALMSNGDSELQRYKLRRFDLEKYFPEILIEGEVGYGKPDRRIYELAILRLASSPESIIMIGDNLKWDVAGPLSAGMRGIWFDVRSMGLPAGSAIKPYAVVRELAALEEYID